MAFFNHSSGSLQGKHKPVPPSVDRAFYVDFFAPLHLCVQNAPGLREPNQFDGKLNRLSGSKEANR